ncbi:uncharacterized protein LOC105701848 [Orussus abietinus]|uniref:uncharacterized protein LOC105701848 n=1 Tax=Orussus abietinus TaxID=222816 RepID=UPI00062647B7|nr:uncharacterized protein LOC105701848 [Orussus abietinus]
MNYGDLDVDSSRTSLRRIARHEESEFSNASILNTMEKFVRTVNEMEETILVPSRLLDLAVGDSRDTVGAKGKRGASIRSSLVNTDLYRLYDMVNKVKVELLWSQKSDESQDEEEEEEQQYRDEMRRKGATQTGVRLGHARCPSTASMQSVQSASSITSANSISASSSGSSASDSDSDIGLENDSGLENEDTPSAGAHLAAENFRRHLRGLHRSITQMTDAAAYLTMRYQADVGGQV